MEQLFGASLSQLMLTVFIYCKSAALRIICNEPYMSPSMPLFKMCNTLNIFDIAYFQAAVFMFQYSKGTLLSNFNFFHLS